MTFTVWASSFDFKNFIKNNVTEIGASLLSVQSSSTVGGQLRDQNMLDSLSNILKVDSIAAGGGENEITHQFDAWHFAKKNNEKDWHSQ